MFNIPQFIRGTFYETNPKSVDTKPQTYVRIHVMRASRLCALSQMEKFENNLLTNDILSSNSFFSLSLTRQFLSFGLRYNMITISSTKKIAFERFHSESIERQSITLRRKLAASLAFVTTIFFLCMENVKSFTYPVSQHSFLNENTFLFVASGLHSMTRKFSLKNSNCPKQNQHQVLGPSTPTNIRPAMTTLKMVRSIPSIDLENLAPNSVRTTLKAFGGWYNEMDPVAKAPIYEE